MATISSVLYANTKHPELKIEYPNWAERYKQILKKWRTLSTESKAPFLQQARDNRSCLKKAQQVSYSFFVLTDCTYIRDVSLWFGTDYDSKKHTPSYIAPSGSVCVCVCAPF